MPAASIKVVNENKNKGGSIKLNVRGFCTFMESFGSCFLAITNAGKLKENKHHLACVQQQSAKYICKMKKRFYAELQFDFDRLIAKIFLAVNPNNKKLSAHSVLTTYGTSFEIYKRNTDDQEKLPGGLFESL
eukprot:14301776-Ditylum_brightwellii.AAC.2